MARSPWACLFLHVRLRQSVLTAGLTLGLLILPVIIVATREALRAIPVHVREGAYGLRRDPVAGGQRPSGALRDSGIMTGVIIGLSRAIGETRADHHDRYPDLHRLPARIADLLHGAVHQLRLAVVGLHRDADPDVQLDLAPRRGIPTERGAAGLILVLMTPADEWTCDLAPLSPAQEHRLVSDAARLRKTDPETPSWPKTELKTELKAETRDFNFYYGDFHALKKVNLPVLDKRVTAPIGPLGLRQVDPAAPVQPHARSVSREPPRGRHRFPSGQHQYRRSRQDLIEVRMRIGMVFQKPNPFPKSIFENVGLWPLR